MHINTHAHAWHRPHAEALILRPAIYAQVCIHIHIHMCINAYYTYTYKHAHIYIYIHVRTYTHIHIYTHTHTKCTYARTQARLERRRGSKLTRSWCRRREPCTSLSFDAIKPHLALPITEKRKVNEEHPIPTTAHHAIMTARRPDNTRSSALVRSLSTRPPKLSEENNFSECLAPN